MSTSDASGDRVYTFDTLVIGGGQAGLAVGYYLEEQGHDFVILEGGERVGDAWRKRWDSLRLFTPAALSGLPGRPFPFPGNYFPTRDETADYLEEYATEFDLPVRLGRRVDSLRLEDRGCVVVASDERYIAANVVVATGPYHAPRIPDFGESLAPSITRLHSSDYINPDQIPEGDVLVVGAGNSGTEIALELSATHRTYLSGRDTGNVPGGVRGRRMPWHTLLGWYIGWWVLERLTADTRLGRKGREFSRTRGVPLVRFSPGDLVEAGVERVPRVEGVVDGRPELANGRVLEVSSVVWATGFRPDYRWIQAPILGEDGYPVQHRGVVDAAPGLYFLGLPFQHTSFSETVGGVGKDARYVADHIARTTKRRQGRTDPVSGPDSKSPRRYSKWSSRVSR